MEPKQFFVEHEEKHSDLYKRLNRFSIQIAYLRTVLFILSVTGFVFFINSRDLSTALMILLVFLVIFALLVKKHNQVRFKRDQQNYLSQINQEELLRLEHKNFKTEDGQEFSQGIHNYSDDLDILGNNSIYQLLNRTSTFPGKKLLADRLLDQKSVPNLELYQKSVSELAQFPQFIQEYQALGKHVKASKEDFTRFSTWLFKPPVVINFSALKSIKFVLPLLFILSTILVTILSVTYYWLLPIVIINMVLLGRYHNYAKDVVESTEHSLAMLKSYEYHLELIDKQKFQSDFLLHLKTTFTSEQTTARTEIKKISVLLENLQARNNILHVFLNLPLLLDLHWLSRIETWQHKNREKVTGWFESLAEIEVLNSLAGQAFSQPEWVVPAISQKPYDIYSKELGHPLINPGIRVNNDFASQDESILDKGKVVLLTGPNMAGKSTFLRTIAVNLVMARMGGVVCAAEFRFDPEMRIFTSMRIKDDLSENISSFYAELSRIKQLLKMINEGVPVLYFLDEILKGTNSADRHKGAVALIRQLIELRVAGFVSTHDLALGELGKELKEVTNFSFESIIENGEINFDYKLREGICQSFNASELMRQMGIKI